jgi:hypothetical protein
MRELVRILNHQERVSTCQLCALEYKLKIVRSHMVCMARLSARA